VIAGSRLPFVIIGIDPGLKGHGYAVIDALSGELLRAAFVPNAKRGSRGAAAWVPTADRVCNEIGTFKADMIVVEKPRSYAHHPANPNDLIEIACAGAYLAAKLQTLSKSPCSVVDVEPRTWKGQVPKGVMLERIRSKLTDGELQNVEMPKQKAYVLDVFDAVGIAKWAISSRH